MRDLSCYIGGWPGKWRRKFLGRGRLLERSQKVLTYEKTSVRNGRLKEAIDSK
jgi:hypothetical protein